jgi:hypothetical protein
MDAEGHKAEAGKKDQQHQRRRNEACQVDALSQPAMTVVVVPAPMGLSHQRIQPQQQPHAEDRRHVVDGIAQSHCADGRRTQPAHHNGVYDALDRPAKFAQHHRNRQRDHCRQFLLPFGLREPHPSNLIAGASNRRIQQEIAGSVCCDGISHASWPAEMQGRQTTAGLASGGKTNGEGPKPLKDGEAFRRPPDAVQLFC